MSTESVLHDITPVHSFSVQSKKAYFAIHDGDPIIWYIGCCGGIYSISSEIEKKLELPTLPWTKATCLLFTGDGSVVVGYEDEFTRIWSMYF